MNKIALILSYIALPLSMLAQPGQDPHKVQVAILFDTSNSMDGLIDQAKSRIWNIVNEIAQLSYNGQTPEIQFALYHYGNSNLSSSSNYIEQLLDLTTDLDELSNKLFALTTNGGSEYCGAVIGQSLEDLKWSEAENDLKMIYIAGNEPFNQGPVSYKEVCKKAAEKGVYINTIYCGDYDQGVREFWKDGAECSTGDYFNIDANKKIAHIETPYDTKINQYNDSLNSTYLGYGYYGREKKAMQVSEDNNAEIASPSAKAERSIAKSKGNVYKNSSWDLVDAVDEGQDLSEIKDEDLPEEFRGKTLEEKEALLESKKADRLRYQKEISNLAAERVTYIEAELKKRAETEGETDDFGTSVNESITNKALEKGFVINE